MDIAEKTYKDLRVSEERKQKIRSLLFASGFSFCMSGLFGQTQIYPVSVSTQLIPPYSVNLADYAAPGCEQLKVIIVQRDLTQAPYMIYLKMQIELNGRVIIRSSPDYIPPSITLDPGIPQVISGTILAQYLDPQNMLFEGYSRESYIRTKLLPEGAYAITFTAYDWTRRDVALSRGGSSFSYLAKTGPPMLNLPFNNAMIPGSSPQNINFHWIPGNASSPNSAFTTKYLFELFEMRVGGINPAEVVRNSQPIYTEETSNTSIAYSIDKPVLEAGIRYVWRVKAFDTRGRDLIRNNGFSEVFSFIYGEDGSSNGGIIDFAEIENFKAQAVSPHRAMLIWDPDPVYDRYKIYYRKQGRENKWYESETVDSISEINGLTPGQTYECRVQGRRKNIWGEFSETDTVLLPLIPVIECGSAFNQNIINNRTPLADLMKFQEFDAGGFMVTVLDSVMRAAGPGRFSGNGFVQVPLFSHKKIKCRFDNILINTDYQMIEGSVRLITDWKNNAMVDLDEVFEGGKNNGEVKEGTDQAAIIVETVIESADVIVLDTASKQILITTGSGEEIQVDVADKLANNPGTITLQDSAGNLYSVDTSTGKATSIGKAPTGSDNNITSLPSIIDNTIGIVTFDSIPGQTKFAIDKWNPGYYNKSNIFKGKYTFMEMAGGGLYDVAFKLIPAGESDVVLASFNMKTEKYADSILFVSGTGSKYTAKATGDGKYILTLPSGNPNDGIDIFATCRTENEKTAVLGKIRVMTYSMQRPKLILVPVNGNGENIDPAVIKSELDKVYKPVAVDWQVSRTENFNDSSVVNNLDVTGSGLFSQYTDGMKQLNNDFIKSKDKNFDQNAIYLFLLQHSSTDENEGMTGDMPRNKQFGYIFTKTALKGGDAALYRTIAHEIAHGAFHLKHTFDSEYQITEKTTNNLLDYTDGIDLIKPQWDAIHDPGLVIGMFEKDEDGANILSGRLILLDEKYTLLLNHVYDNNNKENLKYLEKITKSKLKNPEEESLDLDYEGKREKEWISTWKIRTASEDEILARLIKKIQDATKGEKIAKLSLIPKGIYIGKFNLDGSDYPIAVYCNKSEITNLVKVQVSEETELEKEENKKYIRCEETFFKYMIIAFYEEGNNDPVLIMQIEKFDLLYHQSTKTKWLNFLNIIYSSTNRKLILGNPLEEMEIVGTIENNRVGGSYGCVRYTDDPMSQNCDEWKKNVSNFISHPGKNKVHDGIDLLAQVGTPVYAMFDGYALVCTSKTLGNYILIKSNKEDHLIKNILEDIWVSYGHLSKTEDINEIRVKRGQIIGYTGNTGSTAKGISVWRYHLHLTVYKGGTNKYNRVNPIDFTSTKFDNYGNKIN